MYRNDVCSLKIEKKHAAHLPYFYEKLNIIMQIPLYIQK